VKAPAPVAKPAAAAAAPGAPAVTHKPKAKKKSGGHGHSSAPAAPRSAMAMMTLPAAGLLLLAAGPFAPEAFLSHLLVFVLAVFIGWQVVWNVTPALHTPLMSVTNAISGIILVGGMAAMVVSPGSAPYDPLGAKNIVASIAILLAMINVGGGFLVTKRMLGMFRREA
jgi:NAD(P) transhydrogenase subunit alpha